MAFGLLSLSLITIFASSSYGQISTWDGGSNAAKGTDNWIGGSGGNSGERNWASDLAPLAGDALVFDGALRLTPNNNTAAATNYAGITFNVTAGAFTLTGNSITLGGNITNNSAVLQTINMDLILSATRTFDAALGNLGVGGVISGSGFGITKAGANTLTLNATNTYTGATTINAGTLQAGAAAGGQAFGNGSAITLANVAGASLNLNNFNQTIGSLAGGGTIGGNVTLGNATLTTGGNNTSNSYGGVISGTGGGLTKTGTGTLTLTGNNIYTGATNVNGGTLVINGNQSAATGLTTVSGAGTRLSGSGTLGGNLSIESGAIHSAGNGVGLQTINGATTYKTGSIFEWDLAANKAPATGGVRGTDYDGVNVNGAFTAQSGAIFRVIQNAGVDFTSAFWDTNRQWNDIFNVTGTVNGWAANTAVNIYNTSGVLQNHSLQGSFTITGTTLSWTAIPEPTAALAGLLLVAGLLRRQRHAASVR